MTASILVAYATKYGSTAEVAEAVGARLRDHGLTVDIVRMKEARSLDDYDAVVIGAPFYLGSLLKEARAWLERNSDTLASLPLALFTLGPMSADDDPDEAAGQLDRALEKLPQLHPIASTMFVGAFDPGKLRGCDKVLTALPASPLHGVGARDDRDWETIAAWADGLADKLKSPVPEA